MIEHLEGQKNTLEARYQEINNTYQDIRDQLSHAEAQSEFYDQRRSNDLCEIETLKARLEKIFY